LSNVLFNDIDIQFTSVELELITAYTRPTAIQAHSS